MSLPPLECVVLIDDESFDNKYHTRMIRKTGLCRRIESFGMGEDALNWFRTHGRDGVDMVLLDINMPRMNGFEFLEQACAEFGVEFEKLVVVMVTTSLDPRDQRRAREFDAVKAYVQKPLLPEKFAELCKIIHQRSSAAPHGRPAAARSRPV